MDTSASSQSPAISHGAKALFWYLSMFFTLGIVAFATGAVWYQLINKLVPTDVLPYGVYLAFSQSAVKSAIAALIVGTPFFFLFMTAIRRAIKKAQITLERGVRLWISYLILFLVVAIAIGDVITFVTRFLGGDFTLRFVLKVVTILVITGWIFLYFWLDLKSDDALKTSKLPRTLGAVTLVVIIATLVGGFFIIDSPATSRAKAFDQDRLNDISQLQYQVQDFYRRNAALPATLTELEAEGYSLQNVLRDPQTDELYEYAVIDNTHFELCASFTTDNRNDSETERFYGPGGKNFAHGAERTCYTEAAELIDGLKPLPAELRVN